MDAKATTPNSPILVELAQHTKNSALVIIAVAALGLAPSFSSAAGISGDLVKIGILNDQTGAYADLAGKGSVVAARMAIEDFGSTVAGKKIELVVGNHQNKADIGAAVAREWLDRDGVDMIADFSNSSVAFAVQSLAAQKNKVTIITAASTDFTGKSCTATSVQWVYNSYSNGYGLAKLLTEQGVKNWYFLTVDYAFGQAFSNDMRKAVEAGGGKVLGEIKHPLGSQDMSSFLLQAQSSKANVVAFANAGSDMAMAVKQAAEFGITPKQSLAAPAVFITDVHAMGLNAAQGLQFLSAFYWDRNDETRAWSKKFFDRHGAMPTMTQAGIYSAVGHYLKAVAAVNTDDGKAVMDKMKELPVDDMFARGGKVRADGQMIHDMYLVRVKTPAESKRPWDYYQILKTIPGDTVFKPLASTECPLVKQ